VRGELILRVVVAVVLAAAAAVGFVLWIPVTAVNHQVLRSLGVTRPVSGFEPKPTVETLQPSTSALEAVKKAAATAPAETGTLAVGWKGTDKKSSASVSLTVLPTLGDARDAQGEASTEYLAVSALVDQGDKYTGALSVPGVPHAAGASFVSATSTSGTVKPTAERIDVAVFRAGRVVAVVFVDGAATSAATSLRALSVAEYRHLRQVGTQPALSKTTVPVVAAVVYVVVAIAVIGAVEALPTVRRVVHERRVLAHEEAIRRQRATRGSKVVRRQANRVRTRR
jgi:hypothetical protein